MSNPVKPQSAMTKNGQPFYPLTTIDQVLDSDGGRLSLDSTIQTYTHTKSGTVHNLVGTSTNGRVKFTADYSVGDTFTLNGSAVSVYVGDGERISFKSGQYAYLIVDGSIVHLFGTNKKPITVNLLRPTLQTQTVNGVTCTNNGDGTYTLNGTNNSSSDILFTLSPTIKLENKQYKLLGSSYLASRDTFFIYMPDIFDFDGNGTIFTANPSISYYLNILVRANTTVNATIKPMITDDLSATYDDFVSFNDSLVTGSNVLSKTEYAYGGYWIGEMNGERTITVEFGKTFKNIPFVAVTPFTPWSGGGDVPNYMIQSVTNTSFTVSMYTKISWDLRIYWFACE